MASPLRTTDQLSQQIGALDEGRRQLLKRLILLQEEERHQVAKQLHEETGQTLTSLLVGIKLVEEARDLAEAKRYLPDLKQQTAEALETLRVISVGLWPPLLEDLGLATTLKSYVREFGARHGIDVFFSVLGTERRLDSMLEVAVFRIAQEALVNAGRYSQATQVTVSLHYSAESLVLTVDDNGIGMDEAQLNGSGPSGEPIGIIGMQERAAFVGGAFRLTTAPGHGVTVTLEVPFAQPQAAV